jgi:UDP:flavonoid glycosyltransferase YjiC (YdhE family)
VRELTAPRLAEAMKSAIADLAFKRRVAAVAEALNHEDGPGRAVPFINRMCVEA